MQNIRVFIHINAIKFKYFRTLLSHTQVHDEGYQILSKKVTITADLKLEFPNGTSVDFLDSNFVDDGSIESKISK